MEIRCGSCARTLSHRRQIAAHDGGLARFDERRRAEIEAGIEMREFTDGGEHNSAQQADRHDLEMGAAIGTIHGMVHDNLPPILLTQMPG